MSQFLRLTLTLSVLLCSFADLQAQPALQWEQTIDAEAAASSRIEVSFLTNHNDSCLLAYNFTDPKTGLMKPNLLVYSRNTGYIKNYTDLLSNFNGYSIAGVATRNPRKLEDFYVMLTGTKDNKPVNALLRFTDGKFINGFDYRMGTTLFKTTSLQFDSLAGELLIVSKDATINTCYVAAFNEKTQQSRVGTFTNTFHTEVYATDRDSYIVAQDLVAGNKPLYFDGMPVKKTIRIIMKTDKKMENARSYQWHLAKYSRLSPWNVDELRITPPVYLHSDFVSLMDLVVPDGPTHLIKVLNIPAGADDWLSKTGLTYNDEGGVSDYTPTHEEASRYSVQFTTRGPVLNFAPLNTTPSRFLALSQPSSSFGDPAGTLELGIFSTNQMNLGTRKLPAYLAAQSGYSSASTFDGDTTYLLCFTNKSLTQGKAGLMLSKWYIPDSCTAQYPENLLTRYKATKHYLYTDHYNYNRDGYTFYNKYSSATILAVDPSDPNYAIQKKLTGKTISAGHLQNISYETPTERKTSYWVKGTVTIGGKEYTVEKVLLGWL